MKIPVAATLALDCLSHLAGQLQTPGSQAQRQLLAGLEQESGLQPASLDRLITLFARGYAAPRLQAVLRRACAVGPWLPVGSVAVVAPGNLPVAAWQAVIEPLLAGNQVRVRPSHGHGQAVVNLQRALEAIDRRVAEQLTVLAFEREDLHGWQTLLNRAHCLAIHGSDEAVQAVLGRAAAMGWSGRLRVQGEMRSLAILDAAQWRLHPARLVRRLAEDALLADGRGCMSLRTVVAVGLAPPEALELHAALQRALEQAAKRWPAGRAGSATTRQRQLSAETIEMQHFLSGGALVVAQRPDGWLATSSQPHWLGESWPGPGGRDLVLWTAADWGEVRLHLQPWRGRISTLAVAADPAEVKKIQEDLLISRLCRPGQMQAPRADRSVDGHAPLEGMVRYLNPLK